MSRLLIADRQETMDTAFHLSLYRRMSPSYEVSMKEWKYFCVFVLVLVKSNEANASRSEMSVIARVVVIG